MPWGVPIPPPEPTGIGVIQSWEPPLGKWAKIGDLTINLDAVQSISVREYGEHLECYVYFRDGHNMHYFDDDNARVVKALAAMLTRDFIVIEAPKD